MGRRALYENEKQVFGPIGDQYGDGGGRTIVEDWPSINRAQTASVFGQIIYPITSKFDATLGGRYQQTRKHTKVDYFSYELGHNPGAPAFSMDEKATFRTFLPKIALGYDITDELNIYAMYSKGYLTGGFNFYTTGGSREDNKFDAQASDDYEIGVKGSYESLDFLPRYFIWTSRARIYFIPTPITPTSTRPQTPINQNLWVWNLKASQKRARSLI